MHTRISLPEFDYDRFMEENRNNIVVFVMGSWNYVTRTGSYTYLMCENGRNKQKYMDLTELKSNVVAMLLAAIDACAQTKLTNRQIIIVSASELGFKKGEKGKGVNVEHYNQMLNICKEKSLELHGLMVANGAETIRRIILSGGKNPSKAQYKLVRDRIPEIIEADGKTCTYAILSDEQYLRLLDKKLWEEMKEYQESKSLEELADLTEVIRAVVVARGWTLEQLEQVRQEKAAERGGFEKRILLKSVSDN